MSNEQIHERRLKRNLYKAAWRKARRQVNKEFTVSYPPDTFRIIKNAAKDHKCSPTQYIKLASLSYSQHNYIVVDAKEVNEINSLLTRNYTCLQDYLLQTPDTFNEQQLLSRMEILETKITQILEKPITIEQRLQQLIQDVPSRKAELITFLNTISIDY